MASSFSVGTGNRLIPELGLGRRGSLSKKSDDVVGGRPNANEGTKLEDVHAYFHKGTAEEFSPKKLSRRASFVEHFTAERDMIKATQIQTLTFTNWMNYQYDQAKAGIKVGLIFITLFASRIFFGVFTYLSFCSLVQIGSKC